MFILLYICCQSLRYSSLEATVGVETNVVKAYNTVVWRRPDNIKAPRKTQNGNYQPNTSTKHLTLMLAAFSLI